ECKEKKLRSFSSYKTKKVLSEVLCKYGIDSSEITKISLFEPEPMEIDDEDEELKQCITEINAGWEL
ncbi:12899_t:CDS:1, partial [Funneliformis caledonium]